MVPVLGGVVEHRLVVGAEDHVLEVAVRLPVDEVVERVHVLLVVLAVVQLEGLTAQVGRERVGGVRERGQGERHAFDRTHGLGEPKRRQSAVWNTS